MRVLFSHLLVMSLFFFIRPSTVFAAQDLLVRKEIDVYSEKSTESQVLRTLEKGDRVPLSPKKYGEWRKVLLKTGSSNTSGWVKASDVEGSMTVSSDGGKGKGSSSSSSGFVGRNFLGLSIVSSLARQGARSVTRANDGSTEDISTLNGFSVFPSVFFDGNLGSTVGFRAYAALRSILLTGTLTRGGSTPLEISQSFYTFGGLVRFYSTPKSAFWYGGGLELAKAYKVKVIYANGEEAAVSTADYPFYIMIRGGAGYHLSLSPAWIVNLEAFLNVVPNSKPVTLAGEFVISVAMGF